jgi:GT2 family glycosyltransferase
MDASLPNGTGRTKMTLPRISVIIVNWNNQTDTLACLASLDQCHYPELEVIVVDNASTDGSVEAIQENYPKVYLVRNQENLGFTGGNNTGMKISFQGKADYAFLLNNDAEIAEDSLEKLVDFMESKPDVWAAAPLIYYYSQQNVIWSAGGKIDERRAMTQMLGTDEDDRGQFGTIPFPVDFATGCAMMVRRTAVEKFGMLDDRFFMYYEEVEWCTRMKDNGLLIYLVPQAKVLHKIVPHTRNESPFVHYFMTRNRLLWARSARMGASVFLRVVFEDLRVLLSWTLRPRWRNKKSQRNAMALALWDAITNHYGVTPWKIRQTKI